MPGCGIHFQLASRVLDYWARAPLEAPFPVSDPPARNAFLVGCNAPDMGYFPGGNPLLTDFSHYIRSANLLRALVGLAATDVERAFAWGWGTHILGDVLLHPLVNEAAGELLTGKRVPKNYADDPVAHVQVEMGADADFHMRQESNESFATRPVFDTTSVGYLREAYRLTYGVQFSEQSLLKSLRSVVRFTPWLLTVDRIQGGRFLHRRPGLGANLLAWTVMPLARVLSAVGRSRGFVYALTHSVAPSLWFCEAIEDVLERFAGEFQERIVAQLNGLPHYNLDLGIVEGEQPTYALARKAYNDLEKLQERQTTAGK